MKTAIWPNTLLSQVPANTSELHLVRPVSAKKLGEILSKRSIHTISCSQSTAKRLKTKTKKILEHQRIALDIQNQAGRPLNATLQKILSVAEMYRDHRSLREIESTTGVAKSTAHYWMRYAKRTKLRQSKKTLFIQ